MFTAAEQEFSALSWAILSLPLPFFPLEFSWVLFSILGLSSSCSFSIKPPISVRGSAPWAAFLLSTAGFYLISWAAFWAEFECLYVWKVLHLPPLPSLLILHTWWLQVYKYLIFGSTPCFLLSYHALSANTGQFFLRHNSGTCTILQANCPPPGCQFWRCGLGLFSYSLPFPLIVSSACCPQTRFALHVMYRFSGLALRPLQSLSSSTP